MDDKIRAAKPVAGKSYKLFDGGGLSLLVNPNGSRYWRLKYRAAGKSCSQSVSTPKVSLADARAKALERGVSPVRAATLPSSVSRT